jgi:uncharacterized FlgJ-related protein
MFYKFDKNSLVWKKDWKKTKVAASVVLVLMFASFILGRFAKFKTLDEYEKELVVISLEKEKNKFTEDKLISELKRLNVKFPYIVMAQSIAETGHFKSQIFQENHNLFGMKQATVRINTAKGTENGHAFYDNWYQSLYDYAFYQCRYLSNINTEEEYFLYLSSSYAEAGNGYIKLLKDIISTEKLKDKF